ncbi:hypothetical protein K469DRAFT_695448 [Zopfia rhizophila CBS 207.26]|uniref:Uncharacterized protein n=1 Tax=Zopfia rhizophila CBS 207.26 TaxID=1314779 RepID=A0A6A6DL58_9PEZI|nr:hypothetical protein K469DRAFT_695448 [Zopfia rhizophila CBS 207.26]
MMRTAAKTTCILLLLLATALEANRDALKPPPNAFTDCKWYTRVRNPDFPDYICDTTCHNGAIKISMQQGDCVIGEGAYCCKGKPPLKIEPLDSTHGSKTVQEFKALLEKYMKRPTCTKDTLHVGIDGWYKDKKVIKRSLTAEVAEFDILSRRDIMDC